MNDTATQLRITGREMRELTNNINRAHRTARNNALQAINSACTCGELLAEAKEMVPYGQWEQWVTDNCEFTPRTASRYMRLHASYPQIAQEERTRLSDLSMTAILREVTEPKPQPEPEFIPKDETPAATVVVKEREREAYNVEVNVHERKRPADPDRSSQKLHDTIERMSNQANEMLVEREEMNRPEPEKSVTVRLSHAVDHYKNETRKLGILMAELDNAITNGEIPAAHVEIMQRKLQEASHDVGIMSARIDSVLGDARQYRPSHD